MLRHNLILFYRSLKRHKSSFVINLTGLSTGLACALLIYLWVNDEWSVDKFHANDERLFQVMHHMKHDDGMETTEVTPGPLAKALADEIPEVEHAVSVIGAGSIYGRGIISYDDTRIKVKAQFAGEDFFHVFSYHLLYGNRDNALASKQGIVITESLAMKLFGTTANLVGKTVNWSEEGMSGIYFISGVMEDPPSASTRQFDAILNYELFLDGHDWLKGWESNDPGTFVMLKKGTDPEQFAKKIHAFLSSKHKESTGTLSLQRYSDRYLYGKYDKGIQAGGRIEYVRLFSIIAIFIVIIACINFMNLSTARAAQRVKEIGIKKVVGARRKVLVLQYFGESLFMTILSLGIALLLVTVFLPQFNQLTGKQLRISFDQNFILITAGITLFTGLVAGSYPALYLSRFNPIAVLKGKLRTSAGEQWARKGLVVFQFSLSVILILAVIVVYRQMQFVQSKNLGYKRDNVIYFDTENANDAFMDELKKVPGVVTASTFFHNMTGDHGGTRAVDWPGRDPDFYGNFGNLEAGYDIIQALQFELVEGKPFSKELGSRGQIIFNESAIKLMGLKDPVGKTVQLWGQDRLIVGIVRDFHFESLYKKVEPCFIQLAPAYPASSRMVVRIKEGQEKLALEGIQKFYSAKNPALAFDFKFLDEDYQVLYASEKLVSVLSKYFAGLAILISCLGLLGLAAFTAEKRIKEIGIRKVLGASATGISLMLTKEFIKLVFIASVIAWPIAYYIMYRWLQDFTYKTEMGVWMFAIATGAALLITVLTVGVQAIRAATMNPVRSLRTE